MATKEAKKRQILTVKFLMLEKKIIKFQGDDVEYTLGDSVLKYDLNKFGIKPAANVEVEIKDKVVVYLRKTDEKAEEKKETSAPEVSKEAPKTTEPSKTGDVFTWTIGGIPKSKEVIKFKEGTVAWYHVTEEIKNRDWEKEGIVARANVRVTLGMLDVNGDQKPAVLTLEVIKNEATKTEEAKDDASTQPPKGGTGESKSSSGSSSYNAGRNESIERQCALKTAGEIIAAMIQGGQVSLNDIDVVKTKLTELAEEGIKFIKG